MRNYEHIKAGLNISMRNYEDYCKHLFKHFLLSYRENRRKSNWDTCKQAYKTVKLGGTERRQEQIPTLTIKVSTDVYFNIEHICWIQLV